ncbi:restriction endonuclease subunit S [Bacteroides finegoldii]|uniref:restriction endonuclease subunit S n=1 Tax=Bacteroides finegoldii TaxID=338188 RepID=UPI003569984C
MEEWKKYKLGEIAVIKGGKRLPKGIELISIPNSHPYIRIRDMYVNKIMELNGDFEYVDDVTQKSIQRYIVKQNDIILAIVGNTLGLVSIVGKSLDGANLTENCVKIVSDNLVTQNYIYYYLNSDFGQNEIKKGIVGAAQPKLPIKNIMDISIALPPLKYQKDVIDILSSIDDKIELNRRINDNLEQQAQALFKAWFVDFEPFKDGEFVNSELGMIPKDWRIVSLGEVTKQITEKVGNRKDVTVLSPINSGELVLSKEYFNKQVFSTDLSKYLIVNPLSFAYNPARINIGSIGLNTFDFVGCVSPVYVVFECEPNYQYFFDFFKRTATFKEEVALRAIGGVRQSLSYNDLALIKTIYPTPDVIVEFNNLYLKMKEVTKKNTTQNEKFISLRDSLLPRLMSGELKINDLNS